MYVCMYSPKFKNPFNASSLCNTCSMNHNSGSDSCVAVRRNITSGSRMSSGRDVFCVMTDSSWNTASPTVVGSPKSVRPIC